MQQELMQVLSTEGHNLFCNPTPMPEHEPSLHQVQAEAITSMANNLLLTNIKMLNLPELDAFTETLDQVSDILENEIGEELLLLNQQLLQDKQIPMQTVDAYVDDFIQLKKVQM